MNAYNFTGRAKKNLGFACSLCKKMINGGQLYVRSMSGKLAHFKCAKAKNWKRLCTPVSHKVKRERVSKTIRVVRDGEIIKRI